MANYDARNAEELMAEAIGLEDSQLQALVDGLSAEMDRRRLVEKGLDVGEVLQFDTLIGMVKERTRLGHDDALAMIRAHVPGAELVRPARRKLPRE